MRFLFLFSLLCLSTDVWSQTSAHSTIEKQHVYRYVDEMPNPPYDINEYLKKNMRYPEQARKEGEKGRVFVDFVMQANGKPANVTARNAHRYPRIAQEAIRLIKDMPAWNPGKKDGKAVHVAMTQTVIFIP